MKALLLALLLTVCATAAPIELVDWAIQQPSGWFDPRRPKVELPDFSLIPVDGFRRDWFVTPNYERLRSERDGVVHEVRIRLTAIVPEALEAARLEQAGERARNTRELLETYLEILLDLRGREALPELLELEAVLDRASNYQPEPGGYSLHQEVLSVIAALERVPGPISYGQAQRDRMIGSIRAEVSGRKGRPPSPAVTLLDEILEFPGAWEQNCGGRFSRSGDWLPLYGFRREWDMVYLSEENFVRLRAQREAVVSELQVRIPSSSSMAIQRANRRLSADWSHWERSALETYLVIVQDLNAVETLPALLEVEETLNRVPLYSESGPVPEPCDHVEVLSTISCILRNENAAGWRELQARYSPDSRDRIVETARRFLAATSRSDYRAAAGMASDYPYR